MSTYYSTLGKNNPLRKSLQEPSFWLLLLANLFCLYYYTRHPEGFKTIVWIYWLQSVFIGLFNFLDLLTVKNPETTSMTINGQPVNKSWKTKGCAAFFFLFHYQFFHLVYAIFLLTIIKGKLDILFLQLALLVIVFEGVLSFIRNKKMQQDNPVNFGRLFFLPYLRIIPMHLMILAPAFLGISNILVFLVLKTLADIGMHILTRKIYEKNPAESLVV